MCGKIQTQSNRPVLDGRCEAERIRPNLTSPVEEEVDKARSHQASTPRCRPEQHSSAMEWADHQAVQKHECKSSNQIGKQSDRSRQSSDNHRRHGVGEDTTEPRGAQDHRTGARQGSPAGGWELERATPSHSDPQQRRSIRPLFLSWLILLVFSLFIPSALPVNSSGDTWSVQSALSIPCICCIGYFWARVDFQFISCASSGHAKHAHASLLCLFLLLRFYLMWYVCAHVQCSSIVQNNGSTHTKEGPRVYHLRGQCFFWRRHRFAQGA